jgi:hypothetical protein
MLCVRCLGCLATFMGRQESPQLLSLSPLCPAFSPLSFSFVHPRWVPRRKEAKATRTEEFRKEIDELQSGGGAQGSRPQQGGQQGGGGQNKGGQGQRYGGQSPQPQVRQWGRRQGGERTRTCLLVFVGRFRGHPNCSGYKSPLPYFFPHPLTLPPFSPPLLAAAPAKTRTREQPGRAARGQARPPRPDPCGPAWAPPTRGGGPQGATRPG